MKLHLLFCCIILSLPWAVAGQPTQPFRAELRLNNDFRDFFVWAQPDSSVLLLKSERAFRRNTDPFTLFRYNHQLILSWHYPIELPRGSQFLRGTVQRTTGYLLFEGQKRDDYLLATVNTRTGRYTLSKHQLPESMTFKVTDMQVLDGYLYLTGLENMRVVVLLLNLFSGEILKIPAIYDQSTALTEFQTDTAAQRVEFILAESNGLKGRLQVKRLAPDGRLFSLNFLQNPHYEYLAGRLSPGDSTAKLVAGIYSQRDLRYAQGFFTTPLVQTGTRQVKYHDFTSFSHYFDYLNPSRQEKLRKKVARFRVMRKFYQLRQRMLVHRLYPFEGGYFLVGEMYSPNYQSEGSSKGAFDGYLFSEAVVAAIDFKGNLLYENSLPLQKLKIYELKETVTVGVAGGRAIICFPEDEKIWYKEIADGSSTPNNNFVKIGPLQASERVSSTYPEGLKNWYGPHFLAYGIQTIRGANGFRTVFYLNKLSF